jgi:hypothetical protein
MPQVIAAPAELIGLINFLNVHVLPCSSLALQKPLMACQRCRATAVAIVKEAENG